MSLSATCLCWGKVASGQGLTHRSDVIVEVSTPALLGGRATSLATVSWLSENGPQSERTDNPTALIKKLTEGFKGEIPELTVKRASLEDIYLEMIGGADVHK